MRCSLEDIDFFSVAGVAVGVRPDSAEKPWEELAWERTGCRTGELAADGAADGAAEEMGDIIEGVFKPS
jgi:hypothetical protein